MMKSLWLKRTLLVMTSGAVLGLGLGGGCLSAMVQRLLVQIAFD
jgi:hypothetical protein